MDTSCDHLLHLDSPSLSSELQDTSNVERVEIEFVPDFEEPLENNNFSATDVFSVQHDYDLFLLNQQIDTPPDNLNHQDMHVCEKQGQDAFLIHATDLSHNFALPQFMAQHNCEDLKPIDTPITFSTFTQASSDHTTNQICAHDPMATQCNQSQYLTLLKQICAHNLQVNQPSQLFDFPISTRTWGTYFEEMCYRNRGAGFPSEMVQLHLPKFQTKDD